VSESDIQRTIEAVFRRESPRIVASMLRIVRDIGLAEQLAQDAFLAAVEQWPTSGVPDHPGAWLTTAAKHRALDLRRRDQVRSEHQDVVARATTQGRHPVDPALAATREIDDDMLRLTFLCCHPVLPAEARTALTLRLVAGLTTTEIAHAYLLAEATIAQRIVRAKRTLAEAMVALDMPSTSERSARLASVLEVVYLVFNEGYAGTSGRDWMRSDLCEEALRLGAVLAQLMPREREVHGLLALMELQASRLRARTDPAGAPILLLDQDRTLWDHVRMTRGLAALERARSAGGTAGTYELQAAIAACHARAATATATDWPRIVHLYGELLRAAPSPVVALNRAVAVAMAFGPAAGLHLVEELATTPGFADYHLLPSVRGDLLHKLGRFDEARVDFERAAARTRNDRERELLTARAAASAAAALRTNASSPPSTKQPADRG
jgi:RNA polymerase sigma factor (sigma-70 family)